jgi:arginase family enzyme
MITGCRVALLGLPDDTGVKLNHGRPGSAAGPAAFRAALSRYGVMDVADWTYPKVFDAGDVQPVSGAGEEALLATHGRVREAVRAILDLGLFPIAIGGGHDLTCAFAGAVIEWHREHGEGAKKSTTDDDDDGDEGGDAHGHASFGCVYCDAHLDVRAQVGSGMPFRKLIERHGVGPLLVEGLDSFANAREFLDYFEDHMGHIAEPDEDAHERYDEIFAETKHIVASFDLDAIDMAFAPGVSAMNPSGMSPAEAQRHVQRWGSDPRVACFDIMELSPTNDESGRTSRLAARLFLAFLAAWSTR